MDFSPEELKEVVLSFGEPAYRASQILSALYKDRSESFKDITTLPKNFRTELENNFEINPLSIKNIQRSSDGSVKFLFMLHDGNSVESVLIPEKNERGRMTLCISSQSGCAFGCKFCATGTLGLSRNLTSGEIVSQVLFAEKSENINIDNIVFMGMGEPLHNFENVLNAIEIFTNEYSEIISPKRITVSTVGVAPKIFELADSGAGVKLALSLHATTNGQREEIIPSAKKWKLPELGDAVEYYYRKTKIPVTYEYIMFDSFNDSDNDARRLAKMSARVPSKINLIPFNKVDSEEAAKLYPGSETRIREFAKILRKSGAHVFIRYSAGSDIDAACGQLALSERKRKNAKNKVIKIYS